MDITQLSGLTLSEEELKQATTRLCMFGASGSGEYVRDLQEFITLHAMALLDPGFRSAQLIYSKTHELIHFPWELDDILQALMRLSQNGEIECRGGLSNPDSEYRVPVSTISRLRTQVKEQDKFEKEIFELWVGELSQKYPSLAHHEIEDLQTDLKSYILRILGQHAIESLSLYYGEDHDIQGLIEKFSFDTIRDILPNRSEHVNEVRIIELPKFFKDASLKRKQYIAGKMNSVFILHLLQLDPKCASLAKSQIPGGKLYLDTNFIYRLVGLQGSSLRNAATHLKDLSLSLGYEMVVSPRTITEYRKSIQNSLRKISYSNPISTQLAKAALQATDETDIYTAYWKNIYEKGTYINPSVFLEYYLEIDSILSNLGIPVIDDEAYKFVIKQDSEVSSEETKLENVADKFGRFIRHPDITNHDAFHRLLILQLRSGNQSNNFIETRYWFLTCDSKLPLYDRVSRSGTDLLMPFCVLASQWLQAIRPLSPPLEGLDTAQVESLDSSYLRIYKSPPSSLLNEIMSRFALSSEYLPQVAAKMFINHHFLEQFEKAQNVEEEDKIISEFYENYISSLEGDLQQAKAEKDQALKRIEELEAITRLIPGDSSRITTYTNIYADTANIQSHLQKSKEVRMKNKTIIANNSQSIINIDSLLNQTAQNINSISNLDQTSKEQISNLISQLSKVLSAAPPEKKDEVERIADRVDTLIKEAEKEKPDKEKVLFNIESLKKAAENISSLLPSVIPIVMKLIEFFQNQIN